MQVKLPKEFFDLKTPKEQEAYLNTYLQKYNTVVDNIKTLLAVTRGHRKVVPDDVN
jgi:hypothetical protein